eukprot:2584767-Prymnesium_polylepis.1
MSAVVPPKVPVINEVPTAEAVSAEVNACLEDLISHVVARSTFTDPRFKRASFIDDTLIKKIENCPWEYVHYDPVNKEQSRRRFAWPGVGDFELLKGFDFCGLGLMKMGIDEHGIPEIQDEICTLESIFGRVSLETSDGYLHLDRAENHASIVGKTRAEAQDLERDISMQKDEVDEVMDDVGSDEDEGLGSDEDSNAEYNPNNHSSRDTRAAEFALRVEVRAAEVKFAPHGEGARVLHEYYADHPTFAQGDSAEELEELEAAEAAEALEALEAEGLGGNPAEGVEVRVVEAGEVERKACIEYLEQVFERPFNTTRVPLMW